MSLKTIDPRPLEDRLIIRMLEPSEEKKTAGGLYLQKTDHEKSMFGVVVYRGRGRITFGGVRQERECDKDDIVLVGKLAGTNFVQGGIEYLVIREADVMVRWPRAGRGYHLPEKGDKLGVDEFFTQAQLPAKTGGDDE